MGGRGAEATSWGALITHETVSEQDEEDESNCEHDEMEDEESLPRGFNPLEDCYNVVATGRYERQAMNELLGDVWDEDVVKDAVAQWLDKGVMMAIEVIVLRDGGTRVGSHSDAQYCGKRCGAPTPLWVRAAPDARRPPLRQQPTRCAHRATPCCTVACLARQRGWDGATRFSR